MQQSTDQKQQRKNRFMAIRKTISDNPALKVRANRLQEKMEKKLRKSHIVQTKSSDICSSKDLEEEQISDGQEKYESLFNDKYQIKQKAGEGAHGVVKKCIDRQSQEICAVKTMKLDQEHILYLKKNFVDIKSLKHPNVLYYRALFFEPKSSKCYLVMDYVPFPDLEHIQLESEEELKLITFQLLKTLKYVHMNKICHRDIKPDNILYDQKNRCIKLIDFGISKKVEERGRKRQMLTLTGTPYYRAPEMFQGGGYDQMVDLWALGVTIFKLMTGVTPFESQYHMETIENIIKGEFNFPEKLRFQCSQAPKNLIKRLLKKSRKERLTAVDALKDVWFLDCNHSTEYEEFSHSMSYNKGFFDFEESSPLRFNQSHSPITQENKVKKKYSTNQCTKSFKQIFEQPQSSIFGMEESEQINIP